MFKSKFTDSSASFRAGYTSTNSTMDTDFNGLQVIKGEDGFSPIIDVTETEDGHIITITDKESVRRGTERVNARENYGNLPQKLDEKKTIYPREVRVEKGL